MTATTLIAHESITTQLREQIDEGRSSVNEAEAAAVNIKENFNSKRLYINNISYLTTEEDLIDLFKEFNVQTVKISFKHHQKSLGIAYADFDDEKEAELAKSAINGKVLNNRALKVKNFVPYTPKSLFRKSSSKEKSYKLKVKDRYLNHSKISGTIAEDAAGAHKEEKSKVQTVAAVGEIAKTVTTENPENNNEDFENIGSTIENAEKQEPDAKSVSNDTAYIPRLSPRITDGELREYFHEYSPTAIFIFKSYLKSGRKRLRFHNRYVSALVTLSGENGLSRALEELNAKKLKGQSIRIKPAYISKIEEVKKAAVTFEAPEVQDHGDAQNSAESVSSNDAQCVDSAVPSKDLTLVEIKQPLEKVVQKLRHPEPIDNGEFSDFEKRNILN
ncbi:hypothetical protein WICMUC_005411 [Wickerhamomyces mucosus]|uniref:RRM domain-containing protein n=1 Tax=Wickerhamomyces mucosus TaxID=1378264 RepID=A0A9P8P9C2_9ASCO|nr:hypothetical protein WICMUC_005411 [Wickerhamomyces mucosus]